jgi:hypothetical protein
VTAPDAAFRVKLPALWRQVFPGLLAGAVVGRVLLWLEGKPFSWPQTLPLMAVAAVVVVLVHVLQPARAGAGGLLLMTTWGYRRRLAWADIVSAEFGRFVFLPSLRLKDTRGRSHWIERDILGLPALYALAREHGGPAHPLTRALETPLYALP